MDNNVTNSTTKIRFGSFKSNFYQTYRTSYAFEKNKYMNIIFFYRLYDFFYIRNRNYPYSVRSMLKAVPKKKYIVQINFTLQ